ncbi:MAG: AAA family ATPase [Pseudomonadota bacterium]
MAHIIFLHGPSSSGKSTLARAIQARIEKPFWHISIDHLRDSGVLPSARFKRGDFDWKDNRTAFFDGFHASLAAYAEAGNHLIVEHILDDQRWVDDLRRLLAPHDVLFVGLHCPLDVLQRREEKRGDRPAGSAAQDFLTVHKERRYDLEIHSGEGTDDAVQKVLTRWRSRERCSDFTQSPFTLP